MAARKPGPGRRLLVQGLASAITALLIAGGAAWGAGARNAAPQADEALEAQAQAEAKAAEDPKPEKTAKAAKTAKGVGPKSAKTAKAAKAKGPKAGKANGRALGHGNAHGKRVSAAARGETPPVGSCRNHGHWVSTVAKGLSSCNQNPRPAADND